MILDTQFDETHYEFRQQSDEGNFPLVIFNATITWCPDDNSAPISQGLYVSPAGLVECCSAEAMS